MENLVDIYKKASLVMKPAAMKEGKLYSQQPHSGDGDFTFSRANGTQTRINKHGLIETVADNTPRLSYELDSNGNVSECPHLLLEPTRTNNILQSNDPSVSNWTDPLGRWELLNETTLSPDGSDVRVIELTEDGGSLIRLTGFSISSGTYTLSFYIKDIDGNLSGGNVDVGDEGSGAPSPSFGDVGIGWVRATRTITTTATRSHVDLQPTFSGTTNKVAIWGVQLEAGSYPTSYIPTTTAAVTRTVDNCGTSDTNLINNTEGTLFIDFEFSEQGTTSSYQIPIGLYNAGGSGNQNVRIDNYSGKLRIYVVSSSGTISLWDSSNSISNVVANQRYRVAIKYKNGDSASYVNGELYKSNSGTISGFNLVKMVFGYANFANTLMHRGKVYQAMVFNEALSDSELTELTS